MPTTCSGIDEYSRIRLPHLHRIQSSACLLYYKDFKTDYITCSKVILTEHPVLVTISIKNLYVFNK